MVRPFRTVWAATMAKFVPHEANGGAIRETSLVPLACSRSAGLTAEPWGPRRVVHFATSGISVLWQNATIAGRSSTRQLGPAPGHYEPLHRERRIRTPLKARCIRDAAALRERTAASHRGTRDRGATHRARTGLTGTFRRVLALAAVPEWALLEFRSSHAQSPGRSRLPASTPGSPWRAGCAPLQRPSWLPIR